MTQDYQAKRLKKKKKEAEEIRKLKRAQAMSEKIELKMTSLMDIFVNVLIYLLMNYSASPIDVAQTEERRLPKSFSQLQLKESITVGVTTRKILVNRKPVCDVRDGAVDPSLKRNREASEFLIVPLHEKLKEAVSKRKKMAKITGVKFKGIVTIVADHRMPFRLLAEIMYTAGQAEFSKFKFAIIQKNPAE